MASEQFTMWLNNIHLKLDNPRMNCESCTLGKIFPLQPIQSVDPNTIAKLIRLWHLKSSFIHCPSKCWKAIIKYVIRTPADERPSLLTPNYRVAIKLKKSNSTVSVVGGYSINTISICASKFVPQWSSARQKFTADLPTWSWGNFFSN